MAPKKPSEDLDMDQLAEAELSRLQRQYHIMEGDRRSYSQEANVILQRQRRMIRVLDAEKKELQTNLHVTKSALNDIRDNKVSSELARLINLTDKYDAEIKSEKLQLAELNFQIEKVEKEVSELRKVDVTDTVLLQRSIKTQRNVNNLENQLGVVTTKFNMVTATNGKMREEINHLLKERAHFNRLYQQLVGRLNSGKKVMMDLIEQATLAYDQREEAQNKLRALRERGKQDLQHQSQQMRILQRRLDHDVKLQEFLGVKGQRRITADLEAMEALKREKEREATERKIATYEEILLQIKEFSGEDDIDRLVAHFVKQEEENFAIFNYVNELNNEVESLQDQVCELHKKIESERDLNSCRVMQQQERLDSLVNTLTVKRTTADSAERKLQEHSVILEKLLQGIDHIFHVLGCDNAPILSLLGDNAHVTAKNVMLYLDIIERRTDNLVNVAHYLKHTEAGKETPTKEEYPSRPHVLPIDKMVPTHPCPLCIERDELMEGEDETYPLPHPEVEQRVKTMFEDPEYDVSERLHNVTTCLLPRSRKIVQARYQ